MTFKVSGLSNDDVVVGPPPAPQLPITAVPTAVQAEKPLPTKFPEFSDPVAPSAGDSGSISSGREYPVTSGGATLGFFYLILLTGLQILL